MQQAFNQLLQFLQQGIGAIFKFVRLIWTWAVTQMIATQDQQTRFHHLLAAPLRDVNFRRLVLFLSTWNLAAPFFTVYMRVAPWRRRALAAAQL